MKAHALDLDVTGEHAVPRQGQIPRAFEHLEAPIEELLDLPDSAFGEDHPFGVHRAQAPKQALDRIADPLQMGWHEAEAVDLGRRGDELLRQLPLALVNRAPEADRRLGGTGIVAVKACSGQRQHLEGVREHRQQQVDGRVSHEEPSS